MLGKYTPRKDGITILISDKIEFQGKGIRRVRGALLGKLGAPLPTLDVSCDAEGALGPTPLALSALSVRCIWEQELDTCSCVLPLSLLDLAAIRASLCPPGLQVPPEQTPREEACPCPALAVTGWVVLEFS